MAEIHSVAPLAEPTPPQFRALLEQAPDAIFVADLDGRWTFVNDKACELLGYARDEILGRRIEELLAAPEVERLRSAKARLLQGGVEIDDWTMRRKDGVWITVEVSARILADGQWQAVARDVSGRKAEQAQRDAMLDRFATERR